MRTLEQKTYECKFASDLDSKFTVTVISRTAKFVVFSILNDVKKAKINTDSEGNEFFYPLGYYSMAPRARA
jgi:hypothetical protein